jgi:hypothetical protein
MDSVVAVVSAEHSVSDQRAAMYADLLRRLRHGGGAAISGDSVGATLETLYRRGLLALTADGAGTGAWQVAYVPSPGARQRVFDGAGSGWPENVHKRQRERFRRTEGALLQFILEKDAGAGSAPAQGSGQVDVFITDWSPSPGACAVAVHPDHPIARRVPADAAACFTGRYCRHPVTGDLLPLWSADWVKPEFGTGAVLVNPAHDAVDLEFGRRIGLPIRFCLVPHAFDGTPATWPQPPVIKTGRAIKTGAFDGLPFQDAQRAYFEHMREHGLATRHDDVSTDRHAIARLVPDARGQVEWDPVVSRPTFDGPRSGSTASRMRVESLPLLLSVLDGGHEPTVVSPSSERTGVLLGYRLLRADLSDAAPDVGQLHLVGAVQGAVEGADPTHGAIAALVGGNPTDVVTVRGQMLEQVQRYLVRHDELVEVARRSTARIGDDEGVERTARQVKQSLVRQELKHAFTTLYRLQKQIADQHLEDSRSADAYFAVSHMMLGIRVPPAVDVTAAWAGL